jgi:hypothetical protein
MSVVELNAVTGVGQQLGYETLELQQFFLRHVTILVADQPNAVRVEHGRARLCLCRLRRQWNRYRAVPRSDGRGSVGHAVPEPCGSPAAPPRRRTRV